MPTKRTIQLPINRPHVILCSPINMGGGYIKDLKPVLENYRQTRRILGGYWTASFSLPGLSPNAMKAFFSTKIGSHIRTTHKGAKIWEGLIWSMDLRMNGVLRRVTMADARNAIRCSYTDLEGNQKQTAWYTKANSISRFGRIEETLSLQKVAPATAQAYAQTAVGELQVPLPNAVSYFEPKEGDPPTLTVECVGYAYTLNYEYLNISDTARNLSAAITAALSGSTNGFVTAGYIHTNTVQVAPPDTPTKIWDWLIELTEIGDGTNPFIIRVATNRRLTYRKLGPEPTMKWDGRRIRTGGGSPTTNDPYAIKPGVLRDLTWADIPLNNDYFLLNQRDAIVDEVEAGEDYKIPLMKTSHYEDADLLAAMAANQVDLERHKED